VETFEIAAVTAVAVGIVGCTHRLYELTLHSLPQKMIYTLLEVNKPNEKS